MARDGAAIVAAALALGGEAALEPDHGEFRTQPDCLIVGQDTFRGPMPAAPEMLCDGMAVFRNDTVAAGMCMTPTESDRLNVIGDGGAESFLFRSASLRLV